MKKQRNENLDAVAGITGVFLILVGILFGLYAAIWWGWIGGIVQIIEAAKATPVESMDIALGVVRIIFSNAIGACAMAIGFLPGMLCIKYAAR